MENQDINFAEAFSNETFEGLKNVITAFLKQKGASNVTLEYPNKNVYLHVHKDTVEIHIVSGDKAEVSLPEDEEDE